MIDFKDKTWIDRYQAMGDLAEAAFDRYCVLNSLPCTQFGFNRPPFQRFGYLPTMIKCMPDRIVEGNTAHYFVEVKGCGKDGLIKIKQDNLIGLEGWQRILPVQFAFYDSTSGSLAFPFSLSDIQKVVGGCDTDEYGDNHLLYYLIPKDTFGNWVHLNPTKSIRQLYASRGVLR